ncbi:putative ABC transport system ATP-binding protein [Alkalispirochaeta americana]|uniref:Putative ABC transport system ATP-binding protein n=1 Tax=Alkalispirochaeta americana TaxID=159291 RepID=A0A1N6WMZ4_9SPIO|nr:ABC transporter ATP-binding protein [Alkalispirochaeta americana]SIQ91463.1 putative ABC transport system ATP-binding protein [Alkalispirochaeta americana]
MIELEKISKTYRMGSSEVLALKEVSLLIGSGEFVSIIGPSGSGKTTLMNIIGCLDTPTSGHYRLGGEAVETLSVNRTAALRNATIGFVFQSFNLLPKLNALENVELPLVYAGLRKKERRHRATEMLERVGLLDRARHRPNELSGGQRQRVAIARALSVHPGMVLADEPTGALDSVTGEEIMGLFEELHRDGVTIILVTHEKNLALRARRMLSLHDGDVVEDSATAFVQEQEQEQERDRS